MRYGALFVVGLMALALSACGNNPSAGWQDEEIWHAVTLAEVQSKGEDFLVQPAFFAFQAPHLWALDVSEARLWQFDASLQPLRVFAGPGEGPTELQPSIDLLAAEDDQLLVFHNSGGRVTAFPMRGGEAQTTRNHAGQALLYQRHGHTFYRADEPGAIRWLHPDGTETSIALHASENTPLSILAAGLDQYVLICTNATRDNRFHMALLDLASGSITWQGVEDLRMPLAKADYPEFPPGMVFTPTTIYGLTVHTDWGFVLTERSIQTNQPWQHPVHGRYQILHILEPDTQTMRHIRLYLGNNHFMNNMQPLDEKHWVGYEGISSTIKHLALQPGPPR